jgi:hypothetical protein
MILLTLKTKILICVLFGFQYLAIPRMLLCDGIIPRKRIFVKKFLEVNGNNDFVYIEDKNTNLCSFRFPVFGNSKNAVMREGNSKKEDFCKEMPRG